MAVTRCEISSNRGERSLRSWKTSKDRRPRDRSNICTIFVIVGVKTSSHDFFSFTWRAYDRGSENTPVTFSVEPSELFISRLKNHPPSIPALSDIVCGRLWANCLPQALWKSTHGGTKLPERYYTSCKHEFSGVSKIFHYRCLNLGTSELNILHIYNNGQSLEPFIPKLFRGREKKDFLVFLRNERLVKIFLHFENL